MSFASRINSDIRCFTIEVQGDKEEGTTDDLLYAHKVAKFLDVSLEVVKINSSKIHHSQIYISIDGEDLLEVILFLKNHQFDRQHSP